MAIYVWKKKKEKKIMSSKDCIFMLRDICVWRCLCVCLSEWRKQPYSGGRMYTSTKTTIIHSMAKLIPKTKQKKTDWNSVWLIIMNGNVNISKYSEKFFLFEVIYKVFSFSLSSSFRNELKNSLFFFAQKITN